MTWKKALLRGLLGFPLGVFISYTITLAISYALGFGVYSPVVPSLAAAAGTELNGVALQFLLSGILGFAFAFGSAIFEMEDWSRLRQTVLHFLLSSVAFLPISYFLHWVEHSLRGFLLYYAIFIALYAFIWAVQYLFWKKRIRAMNAKLKNL